MTDDTDVAARLAAALPETLGPVGLRTRAVPRLGIESELTGYGEVLAAALLPVVREIADQRAAEELRDFADLIDRGPTFSLPPSIFSAMARERADDVAAALRGEAGRG